MGGKFEIRNSKSDRDWRIFSDATCAGLSVLIPLPLVDIVFETIFRRRIPATIAKVRRREMAPEVRRSLGRGLDGPLSLSGCLAIGLAAVKYVLRRIWRKIIYIFAVKDATKALTEYWHRAFLIDHMVRADHRDPGADTDLALQASMDVLRDIDLSPLMEMASQTVANVHHVLTPWHVLVAWVRPRSRDRWARCSRRIGRWWRTRCGTPPTSTTIVTGVRSLHDG